MRDFSWQENALLKMELLHNKVDVLFGAFCGAGKTNFGRKVIKRGLSSGLYERVVICGPSITVIRQWLEGCALDGIQLTTKPNWKHEDISNEFHGIATTYQSLAQHPDWFRNYVNRYRTSVVNDEPHHLAKINIWGKAAVYAFAGARKRLGLTGTPFRGDKIEMPFFEYDEGLCVLDFDFQYKHGVAANINRFIEFPTINGDMTWEEYGAQIKATFDDDLSQWSQRNRLRTATMPNGNWATAMLDASIARIKELRARAFSDPHRKLPPPAGLFVANDIDDARVIRKRLLNEYNIDALLVHSRQNEEECDDQTDGGAHAALRAFKNSDQAAIVSVGMVTEGVDIPRIQVIGYSSVIETDLSLLQLAGRGLRNTCETENEHAWMFLPKHPQFCEFALKMMKDAKEGRILAENNEDQNQQEQEQERQERGLGEGSTVPGFRPISAERGRLDDSIFDGSSYTRPELERAAHYKSKFPNLAHWADAAVAKMLRQFAQDLGVPVESAPVFTAPFVADIPVIKQVVAESAEAKRDQIKRDCNTLARKLAHARHPGLSKRDIGPFVPQIHTEWASKPGRHWQQSPEMTITELEHKKAWLEYEIELAESVNSPGRMKGREYNAH